ncbi:MAG: flagellar biosynthesis protein FlhF [Candidatus Nitronauta litoralis]|uniref:Flagellar biosynthesis protein FlhF n=1 Tax=Candidatus Nitronauta litoralis TaxID=2705533 RepID=A0A7T0G1C8_9BACT|nr:MAG: flagellar biosynthesis protein FlhF [Candidatus Nitronauta litoralis]
MLVKKFLADNYAEALERVKQELGEDALILSTRSIKFHPEEEAGEVSSCVEITAALEREPVKEPEKTSKPLVQDPDGSSLNIQSNGWDQIQPLIQSLMTKTDRARSAGLKPGQMDLFGHLIRQGVNEEYAVRLFTLLNSKRGQSGILEDESEKTTLGRLMRGMLKCPGPLELEKGKPKIVALVGPTGSGKTTTVAKLAAHFALAQNKKVAIVSLDTFRVGAVEQLQAYGELMDVPVESAQGRLDFRKTVQKHSDKELILVDTTGKSHRDTEYALELAAIFHSAEGDVETHLVTNVTAQDEVINYTVSQFSILKPDRVLFTKIDEGVTFGHLFNFAVRHRLPFSYFTAGQRVPEDIETASKGRVIRLIFD